MPPRPARPTKPETDAERMFRWTLWAVFVVTVARLVWIALDRSDLFPTEAMLWVESRSPGWGYVGRPPLTAWLVWASTALFHDTGPAVRLPATLLQFVTALTVFGIARRLYDLPTAFWSAVTYATLPGVFVSAAVMSDTAPLLLAWVVALDAFLRARATGDRRWWLIVGIALGLGLLVSYAMLYWLLGAFLYVVAVRDERRHVPILLGATALGLIFLSPNLLWNATHGYVGFHDPGWDAGIAWGRLLQSLGWQAALFGPLLFAALIVILVLARHTLADRRGFLLACFALPPLVLVLASIVVNRAWPDWAAPAAITASILVVAWLLAEGRRIVIFVSLGLHIAAALVVAVGVRDITAFIGLPVPVRYDPLHGAEGWRNLGRAVSVLRFQHPGAILMADDPGLLAELMFYVTPHPMNALEWNPGGTIHDQFDLRQHPLLYRGANFLLVSAHPEHVAAIKARFAAAGPPQSITIFVGATGAKASPSLARRYAVQYLEGFKGYP